MNEQPIRYCALTTLSLNLRAFVLPSALYLADKGYDVTVGCKRDDHFAQSLAGKPVKYLPLGIERGFSVKGTIVGIWQLYRFFRMCHFAERSHRGWQGFPSEFTIIGGPGMWGIPKVWCAHFPSLSKRRPPGFLRISGRPVN